MASNAAPTPAIESRHAWSEQGVLHTLLPGVHGLRMPLPYALAEINLWLLEDEQGHWMIDSGLHAPESLRLWRQLHETDRRVAEVSQLLIGHHHPDHIGLGAWLSEQFHWPVAMSAPALTAAQQTQRLMGREGMDAAVDFYAGLGAETAYQALQQLGALYQRGVPALPTPQQWLADGQILTIGAHAWRVLEDPGHAPGHLSLYCAELKLLIAGDLVLPHISANVGLWPDQPDTDPLADYLASLDRLAELPPETLVLPSHGQPYVGLHRRIEALRDLHLQRVAQLAALSQVTEQQALARLFPQAQQPVDRLFALAELLAYGRYLEQRGG